MVGGGNGVILRLFFLDLTVFFLNSVFFLSWLFFMKQSGENLSAENAQMLMDALDKDLSGEISVDEFMAWIDGGYDGVAPTNTGDWSVLSSTLREKLTKGMKKEEEQVLENMPKRARTKFMGEED